MIRVLLAVAICLFVISCVPKSRDTDVLYTVNSDVASWFIYKNDPQDYWQPANETITKKTGDCEDFAIVQAAILLKSGKVHIEDLKFVIYVQRNTNQQHLVLLVYNKFLLDQHGIYPYSESYRSFDRDHKYYATPIINIRTDYSYFNINQGENYDYAKVK